MCYLLWCYAELTYVTKEAEDLSAHVPRMVPWAVMIRIDVAVWVLPSIEGNTHTAWPDRVDASVLFQRAKNIKHNCYDSPNI